jgi:hypothetical protein
MNHIFFKHLPRGVLQGAWISSREPFVNYSSPFLSAQKKLNDTDNMPVSKN